ncbi:hypothetical protein ACN4EE_14735 [Geminocystis sp. CENA526]|uniref:hypothetical protein n=1 Tax=Geminocystis sp. CENA526 TaxID=1355871 RepID=UPI003D6F4C8C
MPLTVTEMPLRHPQFSPVARTDTIWPLTPAPTGGENRNNGAEIVASATNLRFFIHFQMGFLKIFVAHIFSLDAKYTFVRGVNWSE